MFKKILVANRGEIAVRIIRACKELGVRSVAVHSDADADAHHVRLADEHLCIGPAEPALSYRNIPNILSAAEITACDAIHPGYGFLGENAHFAEVCESIGIKFIGPTSENIATMGDKSNARELMIRHGLPVLPGSEGEIASEHEAAAVAAKIGYPVIIKASAGGGGRGMRVVNKEEDLAHAFQAAKAEAASAFGDTGLYVERFFLELRPPRERDARRFFASEAKLLPSDDGERPVGAQAGERRRRIAAAHDDGAAPMRQLAKGDAHDFVQAGGRRDLVVAVERTAVRDQALLVRLRRRPSEEWNLGPQVFEVPYSEPDLCTCLRATCLQFCSSGKNCNQVAAERGERRHESTLETGSISQQEHDRRDSPRHAEHGQHASTAIVPHRPVSLFADVVQHCLYSCRRASTGSSRAALRAG